MMTTGTIGGCDTSHRRSRLDIMLNVLSVVRDGVDKPTRIMYAANLSYGLTQDVLLSLVRQGLLREIEDTGSTKTKKMYKITEKGDKVVEYFDKARDLLTVEEVLS